MEELEVIQEFYRDKVAERSQLPLMNHIYEGLGLLSSWNRSDIEFKAFCIHPIVQNYEPINVSWSSGFELACEYRDIANSYLCRPETDNIKQLHHHLGPMSISCAYLLLADKIQNQKDFRQYHLFTHKRGKQLEKYFNLWIETLLKYYI